MWARHASGWSVWTRVATLPFLLLAVWSHAWLGGWALLPIITVLLWTWLNPRLFPPPRTTRTWAAKATFGEHDVAQHRMEVFVRRQLAATPLDPRMELLWGILMAAGGHYSFVFPSRLDYPPSY